VTSAEKQPDVVDPRIYMAAERTFLAWIRTGIALMGFGFVIARFGVFLRELDVAARASHPNTGMSLYVGLLLLAVGMIVCAASAIRHGRYLRAIDAGRFREAYSSTFAFSVVVLLVLVGAVMAVVLVRL
jgi:putative membrane protein